MEMQCKKGEFYGVPKYVFSRLYQETIKQIIEIYKFDKTGGALHIVLDDGNNEKHHIQWCKDYIKTKQTKYNLEQIKLFEDCANNLFKMNSEHRVGVVEWIAFQYIYGRVNKSDDKKYGEN